jgi:peptide chain release factor 3
MAVERERGISVSSAVTGFEHEGLAFSLLDTPGHQDFSPLEFSKDTYRALTAVPHPSLPRSRPHCGRGCRAERGG